KVVDFAEAGAELLRFELQEPFTRVRGVALGCEVSGPLLQLLVLSFALQFFSGGRVDLRSQRVHALVHFREKRVDALQYRGRGTVALFKGTDPSGVLRGRLRCFFTPLAKH